MAAGVGLRTNYLNDGSTPFTTGPKGPLSSVYDAGATQQAQDYDNIMQGYEGLANRAKEGAGQNQLSYVPINPVFSRQLTGTNYERTPELKTALSGFTDFSRTGGYSGDDIANIRERSISPIRSIYSSAQENLKRQKVLQGGYSPNYGAVSAKMARDASSKIGDITTNVNAQIAQMVQAGKLSGLQGLSPLAARDSEFAYGAEASNNNLKNQTELMNAEEQRRADTTNAEMRKYIDEINARNRLQSNNTELQARQGQTSLYGTTPALTNTFGQQVLQNNAQNIQAAIASANIKQPRANAALNMNPSGMTLGRGM